MTLHEGSELGATTDKAALIVGDPATIESIASTFTDEATRIESRHDALKALRVPTWSGLAADAWEATMAKKLPGWLAYSEILRSSGAAMSGYATALRTAQGKAQEAIDKYAAGDATTTSAATEYNRQVRSYNDSLASGSTTLPPRPGPWVDPGAAQRSEAQEILDDARSALDDAGNSATAALGDLPGSKSSSSGDWIGGEGKAEGPSITWDWWDKKFGEDKTGPYDDKHEKGPFSATLGKAEGDVWVYKGTRSWEDYLFGGKATADGEFRFITADGSAEAAANREGLRLNADGTITVFGLSGEYNHDWEYGGYGGKLEGAVEGSAEGHANFEKSGVHVGGEAFAGGKVSGTGEASVVGVTVKGNAEGWGGAGAGIDGVFGYDDGKLKLGGSGGIAFGLGGKLGGEVTIDIPKLTDSIEDGGRAIGSLFD